ncbi:MAG: hypothetical protein LC778_17790 [Acidobacteria bacterium]|nr:hypothetical protein [Acidobacteriota bacterium]
MREDVGQQLTGAYIWCVHRFPLSVRSHVTNVTKRSITEFIVGHSNHQDQDLSASSAQAPGIVFIASSWPLRCPFRLASLIAHEGIHQGLFIRELVSSPVRPKSLGYSPWKNTIRPGRLVWHAFWTFACQFTMLGESVLRDRSLLRDDTMLIDFLADMEARLSVCLYSLEFSNVVSRPEFERCNNAFSILGCVSRKLMNINDYKQLSVDASDAAFGKYEAWAKTFVETYSDSQMGAI